ncbi:glycoside hydrolase family 172 protein [Pseudonocardia nematodicida]|uniref:Glycoside hydrolase family 172 protein n=1 Tax=Pseudonocardia nematodicida TaxID=1206997 RepID=A0ABV1KD49_9PSEU
MFEQWSTLNRDPAVRSRSINAENPTGADGGAAHASSPLGPGRKGRAYVPIAAGGTRTLADLTGPGTIRHIWITLPDRTAAGGPFVLRDLVLRAYWDDADAPAVEVPLGDFFCNGFATRATVTSLPITVAPTGGMNCYLPMPFRTRALLTLESRHGADLSHVYYQVDYTEGDDLGEDTGYLHAQWRRSNADLPLGTDHPILDGVTGTGRYVGTYIALTALSRWWWGEGEVKFFVDDDRTHPTLCSTGLEDYAGGAWCFQDALRTSPEPEAVTFSAPFSGYPFRSTRDGTGATPFETAMPPSHGLYRWHLPDPVLFSARLSVTLQQIGAGPHGLVERQDDISTVAYLYLSEPVTTRPPLPPPAACHPR